MVFALLAHSLAPFAQEASKAELHFNVTSQGKSIGGATYTRATSKEEVRKVLTLNLKSESQVVSIVIDTTTKVDGMPVRKSFVQNGSAGGSLIANFDQRGAEVIKSAETTPSRFPAPLNGSIVDPTVGWFAVSKPTVGAKATYYNFNVQALAWEETTATYIEDVDKKVAGKSYPSHHLRISSASGSLDEFIDDHGDPIVIDQGSLLIERSEAASN